MLPLQRSTLYFSVHEIPKGEEQVPRNDRHHDIKKRMYEHHLTWIHTKLYECGEKLQLPEGVIPPEVQHKFGHKMLLKLKIPLLNTKERDVFIAKNTAIMTLQATDKVQEVCSFECRKLDDTQEQTTLQVAHLEETKQSQEFVTAYTTNQLTD